MSTFVRAADRLLETLCESTELASSYDEFRKVQSFLLQNWGSQTVPEAPPYRSAIGDDHSPFEYSIALGAGRIELRLLVEAQGRTPDALANQVAALALNQRLAQSFQASFERFERIRPLFLPHAPNPPFSLWHAVCLNRDGRHDFKVYLNPQVQGAEHARELTREALGTLGLRQAQHVLDRIIDWPGLNSIPNYFSLDLSDAPHARVKVYFQHSNASARQLDELFALAPSHRPGDVVDFCRAVTGGEGPYRFKPLTSCFSFVEGKSEPTAATFHMPIAHYVPNDAVTVERVARYLETQGLDSSLYVRILHRFAMRSLEDGAGIQSYASFRREPSGIRLTAYLSPELFRERRCDSELRLKAAPSVQPPPGSGVESSASSELAADQASARRA